MAEIVLSILCGGGEMPAASLTFCMGMEEQEEEEGEEEEEE